MKKLFYISFFIMLLLLCATLLNATITPKRGKTKQNITILWDYYVRDGDTTQISTEQDTISALGAKDSLFSRFYENRGEQKLSLTLNSSGGSIRRYSAIIQTVDRGGEEISVGDFKNRYWVHFEGAGDDSCYVATALDSCTVTGRSSGIFVPLLGVYAWRLLIITNSTHSGNTLFNKCTATNW